MKEEELAAAIGAKIASLRKERNLTQKQLAEKIFTSDANLSKWERGKALPDLSYLLSICAALDVTITYFTDDNISGADIINAQRDREIKGVLRKVYSITLALAALPIFIFAAARPFLPDSLPVHFNGDFQADRMGQPWELALGSIILFILMAAALLTHFCCYMRRPHSKIFMEKKNVFTFAALLALLALTNIAIGLVALISASRAAADMGLTAPDIDKFPGVFAALMCVIVWIAGVGCTFVSRNEWAGFRIPSAFASDYNWRVYNSTAGILFMAHSLAFALAVIFMPRPLTMAESMCASLIPTLPIVIIAYLIGRSIIRRHEVRMSVIKSPKEGDGE